MNRKCFYYVATIATAGILLTQGAINALAQNSAGGQALVQDVNRMQNQASRAAQVQQTQLQSVINRSNTLITNRIGFLNNLLSRLQSDTRLLADEKSSLATTVQADISGLTTLKTKIDADTSLETARADEKQIITGYYVYAMFVPKVRLLIVLDNLQTVSNNVQALVPQIQNLINTEQAQGKDVSKLQAQLNDVSAQLQTINSEIAKDKAAVLNVSVGTANPGATFAPIRQDIAQIIRVDLAKIRADFAQMRPLFHQLIISNPRSSTPSAKTATGSGTTATKSAGNITPAQ